MQCSRAATATFLGLALVALAPASIASGLRLSVDVAEPFEFQGRLYPAGHLTLEPILHYNPTATIDRIWIADECVGMIVADRRRAAHPAPHDSILFQRNERARLELVGYSLRGSDESFLYRAAVSPLPGTAAAVAATIQARDLPRGER
jgi:hypothetical protein